MRVRKVAVVGGGPGGLYAARLPSSRDPACAVTVLRAGRARHDLRVRRRARGGHAAQAGGRRPRQPARHGRRRVPRHDMTLDVRGVGGGVVRVRNDRLIGVARTELLAILQRHAEKAGVALEFGARRTAADLDADLVVAADGVEQRDPGGRAVRRARRAGPGPLPVVRHRLRPRRRRLRAGHDRARRLRHPRLPVRERAQHVPRRDRRGHLAPRRVRRHHRRHAVRRVRRGVAALPRDGVRRAAPRPPVDRQPHPVAAVPHRPCDRWSDGAHRAARRRRPHGALLHRLRHEARDGGRDRAGRGAARRAGPRDGVRGVRAPSPSRRRAAAGARPAQQAVVGVVPGAAVAARRAADGGVHVAGGERAARPVRRDQPGRRRRGAAPVRRRCGARPTRPPSPGGCWSGRRQRRAGLATDRRRLADPWGAAGDAVVARARGRALRVAARRAARPRRRAEPARPRRAGADRDREVRRGRRARRAARRPRRRAWSAAASTA